jgi:1-acyl-sn-glycerol-3-phosphate acyltransferase
VLIYPEGTVTKDPDLWPMRPRPGVAALALSGDFPVIPVAHWGSHRVYTSYGSGRRFKPLPRKDVYVVAGEPIDLSAWRGKPVDSRAIRDVSYLIMGRIREMVADLRGERPPVEFFDPKQAERRARVAEDGPGT